MCILRVQTGVEKAANREPDMKFKETLWQTGQG